MKGIIRRIIVYSFILYLLPKMIPGVEIKGDFLTLLIGGSALTLMFLTIKPILNIISFPVNILTLGLFSVLTNALILYLLTIFVPEVSISAFNYEKFTYWGFAIPKIVLNTFFAYVFTAFVLSFIDSFTKWVTSK